MGSVQSPNFYVTTPVGFERANAVPLDKYSYFEDANELYQYIKYGAIYPGQEIVVKGSTFSTMTSEEPVFIKCIIDDNLYPRIVDVMSPSSLNRSGEFINDNDSSYSGNQNYESIYYCEGIVDEKSTDMHFGKRGLKNYSYYISPYMYSRFALLELFREHDGDDAGFFTFSMHIDGEHHFLWKQNMNPLTGKILGKTSLSYTPMDTANYNTAIGYIKFNANASSSNTLDLITCYDRNGAETSSFNKGGSLCSMHVLPRKSYDEGNHVIEITVKVPNSYMR